MRYGSSHESLQSLVRSLSDREREIARSRVALLRSTFTLRRSQMLLASSRGDEVPQIATNLGCGQQTVRDAIHDFNARGVDALVAKSSRPRRTRAAFDQRSAEASEGDATPLSKGIRPRL